MPSLCKALGWPVPETLPGRASLIPDAAGRLPAPTPLTVLENMLYGPAQQATLRWPDLRVVDLSSGRGAWYRLADDPGAQHRAPAPADSAALRDARRQLLADWDELARRLNALGREQAPLSEAAKRRLRSLGY